MNRLGVRLAFLAAACVFSTAAFAQQFKWVDANGRVQYGDTPPPGVKATRLKPPPPGVGAGTSAAPAGKKGEKKALTPEEAFQKRQKDAAEAADKTAKDNAEAETNRANCEAARNAARGLSSGERVSTTSASGERIFLDDAQRARELERAQKAVAEWCK